MRIAIACVLFLIPHLAAAQSEGGPLNVPWQAMDVQVAGAAGKGPAGNARTLTRRCTDKWGYRKIGEFDVPAHWMTTEEADFLLRHGVEIDYFDDPMAFRAVEVQWKPNGTPHDPYLGAVGSTKSFPGAILWQGNRKWFVGNQGNQVTPMCAWSAVNR